MKEAEESNGMRKSIRNIRENTVLELVLAWGHQEKFYLNGTQRRLLLMGLQVNLHEEKGRVRTEYILTISSVLK